MENTHVNTIEYQYHEGSSFSLYPIKGIHKPKDIQRAKFLIKEKHKDARIQIRWKQPDEAVTLPEKIPDNAIIKNLKMELGKKEAYIEELEEKLKILTDGISAEEKKEIKEEKKKLLKDELIKTLESKNTKLKRENEQLRKTNSELVTRMYQANNTP